jgi:hypothetical protein
MCSGADDEVETPYFPEKVLSVRASDRGLFVVDAGSVIGRDSQLCEAVGWVCGPFAMEGDQDSISKKTGVGLLKVLVENIAIRAFGKGIAQCLQLCRRGYGHAF